MTALRSLQLRLALVIGLCVTLLWAGATALTATILRHEMDEVYDSALQETAQRGAEIEGALKRLNRVSEKMMQQARAKGGHLRTGTVTDLRPILRLIVDDLTHGSSADRIALTLVDAPVLTDLDRDRFAILCRNLIETGPKHGVARAPVRLSLSATGQLSVANNGPVSPAETLRHFTPRFDRGAGAGDGSGLGLTIVHTIAKRADCRFALTSPIQGQPAGIGARVWPRGTKRAPEYSVVTAVTTDMARI